MKKRHSLLSRQLKKAGINPEQLQGCWQDLIDNVNKTYEQMDNERYLAQRSIEISSNEMKGYKEKIEKEARYILSVMTDSILIIDENHKVIEINPATENLLGLSLDKIINQPFHHVIKLRAGSHKELIDCETVSNALNNQKPLFANRGILDLNSGKKKYVSFRFNPLSYHEGVQFNGCALILSDISDNINIEHSLKSALSNAKGASEEKSMFLANMSHEIRTPMNGIVGMLKVLQNTSLNACQNNYVEMSLKSANNLITIINDILDFSKLESNNLCLNSDVINLNKELKIIEKMLCVSAAEKGISLGFLLSPKLPNQIIGDVTRLTQILVNLIGNAIKFTSNGGEVLFRVNYHESPQPQLKFSVQDSGIGIKPENIDLIFESFKQADNQSTREYGGTGLGLAISKQLIELMGGDINVESEVGIGSTFEFTINIDIPNSKQPHSNVVNNTLAQQENSIQFNPKSISETNGQSQEPLDDSHNFISFDGDDEAGYEKPSENDLNLNANILIVEDNPINQAVASEMLKLYNLSADLAHHGEEAIKMLKDKHYDIVFMDCHMPVLDGLQATRIIRDNETEKGINKRSADYTKIVALTANAFEKDKENCLNAGMDDYMSKPFQIEELYSVLKKHIHKSTDAGDPAS